MAELDGLPPARPLESLEGGPSVPAGSGPATTVRSLPPYPQERNFGLAAAEVIGLELLPWAFNRYVSNRDAAYISFRTIKSNYQTGFTYDRDAFTTNLALHPFHGSLFFNSARTNGFSFWESAPFALVGSFLWELHMEKESPSINDLVNTTVGGMTRGEIQYRVSNMILDNTKSGFERFLREAGGLALNPIGGFNRLIKGQMWTDFQNPPDRFPSRLYLELDGMYRHRAGDAVAGEDTEQGGFSIGLRYGDLFEGDHRAPFEYFDVGMDVVQPASALVTRIESRGLLKDFRLCDCRSLEQRLGLLLHFNYFNNAPAVYGSQELSANHLLRVPLGAGTDLRTEISISGMPMAALQIDYEEIGAVTGAGRSYDFGPAGGARAALLLRRREMDLLSVGYQVFWQHPSNGLARNNRVQSLNAEGRMPLGNDLLVGAGWSWTARLSTYDRLPTVDLSGTSWRAFVGWHFRDRRAVAPAAAASSATASAEPKGRWEVTGFGGGFFGSRVYTSSVLNVMTATTPTFGARVGYGLTRVFSLEAGWSHAASALEPQNPDTSEPAGPDSSLTVNTYELDGLFGFGSGPVLGYVGIGGGVMNLDPNVPSLDADGGASAFAANVAVGGKFFLTDAFALRLDGRYRWRAGENRLGRMSCDSEGCVRFDTNLYSSVELTGGLTFRF